MARIAIYTLPRPPKAIGGEDQVGSHIADALRTLGHEPCIFYSHEFAYVRLHEFDALISNGCLSSTTIKPSCFWHFNEQVDLASPKIASLGYTHVATNVPDDMLTGAQRSALAASGITHAHVPLAAPRRFCSVPPDHLPVPGSIAYIGNLNDYKRTAVDKWLVPLASKHDISIYGGKGWLEHPVLAEYWCGILPQDGWPGMVGAIAETWINFRSLPQAEMGMANDRIFWLMAAGVDRIISDYPPFPDLANHAIWCETPEEMVGAARSREKTPKCRELIAQVHCYEKRMETILGMMGIT
jgi:hypothetical protein